MGEPVALALVLGVLVADFAILQRIIRAHIPPV
jgi:hypothetical protein